ASRLQRIRKIYRIRIKRRRVGRSQLSRPFRVAWVLKDEDLQIVFSNRDCLERRVEPGLTIRELCLDFSSFEWSLSTGRNLCFDVSQALARQIQIGDVVLLIAQCEHQFPVGLLYTRDHVDCSLAK